MTEVNKQNLENAVRNLPQSEPDPQLWYKIETFLDFDERIKVVKNQLPTYEPQDYIWIKLKSRLEKKDSKKIRTYKLLRYSLATAASILLFTLAWLIIRPQHNENITISYSVENNKLIDSLPLPEKEAQDSENYIKLRCSKLPGRCESPEISSLKNELENLNTQYKKLQDAAKRYGADESILQATEKIESTKSRVMKEIISKLKS